METFPGADGIFHQTAIPSVPRSASNKANVTGTVNVLVVAKGGEAYAPSRHPTRAIVK